MSSAPCSAVYRVCLSVQIFTVILFVLQIDAILRKEAMKAMTETFYAAIFGYDEGILSDDCVLAAALWRNLFNRQCEDPQQLELMVEYVRKQVCLFLSVSS
ncbi:Ubiquinol-cytochrome-c reductase complex assembly factor 1 [Xenotaenia resolanae]|uniref:Ubiquinol-cytochrome-c reductase complex assembly factor 1 n=1 Tax=Xenotaenia resolanae TaxID=208358 RepID=A0ABV0WZR1_9TELE